MKVLVAGVAGFIGRHVTERALHEGHPVVGVALLGWRPKTRPAEEARWVEAVEARGGFTDG